MGTFVALTFGCAIYACVGFTVVSLVKSAVNKAKKRKENEVENDGSADGNH